MQPHTVNGSQWEELTDREMRAELDGQVQRLLAMTLEEFFEAHRLGKLPQTPAVDYLVTATGAVSTREP